MRSVPEEGEVEAHVALGGARAVGRAPLAHGLAGAAEAVLAATTQVEPGSSWQAAWVRTVETTADGHFVVAVALVDPEADGHRHGIATGLSPIEAAARRPRTPSPSAASRDLGPKRGGRIVAVLRVAYPGVSPEDSSSTRGISRSVFVW